MTTADDLLKKYGLGSFNEEAINDLEDDLAKDTFAKIMKWNTGRNVIRVIPQPGGRKIFERTKVHFVDRPDGKTIAFACAAEHYGQVCLGCTMRSRAQQAGKEDLSKKLGARSQYYFACVRRGEEKLGPQIAAFSRTQMTELSKQIKLRRDELAEIGETGVDVLHPITGYDVIVERTGTQRDDTEYSISLSLRPKPLTADNAELAAWLEALPDNTKPRELKTENEIKAMLGAVQAGGGAQQLPSGGGRRSIEQDATGDDEYGDDGYGSEADDDIPY